MAIHHVRRAGLAALLLMALIAAGAPPSSSAADGKYPAKPIRLVVTFAPGGSSDILARVLSEPVGKLLGQPIIVDNRPGAGGSVGGIAVASAAPDGYTLLMSNSTPLSIGPFVLEKQPYDPIKSFSHVFYAGSTPLIIMASPKNDLKTLKDIADEGHRNANGVFFGSGGPASIGHIVGEIMKNELKIPMQHVAYRGGAPMTADLISGQVPIGLDVITAYVPQVKAGTLRGIAVTSPKRFPLTPDIPTVIELGYPHLVAENYFGVSAPAGTPKEIVDKLHAAFTEAIRQPDVMKKLDELGIAWRDLTSDEFTAYVSRQAQDWAPAIKGSGVKL